jgi:hypothetical protein
MLAAQVILRDTRPAAEAAVRAAFAKLGFTLGPTFAGNFSIAAPLDTFERVFGVSLGAQGESAPPALPDSLPIQHLSEPVASAVSAVVFTTGYRPF